MTISLFQNLNIIIVCWIIFLLYWLISSFFVKKSVVKRDWKGQIIWRLVMVALIILFIAVSKSQGNSMEILKPFFSNSLTFQIIWSIFVVAGLFIAIWARIDLGRNWSGYVTYKKEHELVTSGPYKVIRHPIYTGAILMVIGTFLYYPNIIVLTFLISWSTMFILRTKKEEKIMIKLFGKKYIDYMKRTKRLIPGIW